MQQFAAGQMTAMPVRTTAQGKPAAARSTESQGPTAGDIGNTGTLPAAGQIDKDASSAFSESAFNQLVAQMVADSAGPGTAPTLAVAVPGATAQTVKLPAKSTTTFADQSPELPALAWTPPARRLTDTAILPVVPASGRREDTRDTATSKNDQAGQPPAAPVDVNVPIPIAPKLQLPSFAGGGPAEQKPVQAAAISSTDEPAAIMLQPKPVLEVTIHFNQTETPVIQAPAQPRTDTLPIEKQTSPAAQPSFSLPAAVAMPTVATPTVTASTPVESRPATHGAGQDIKGRPDTSPAITTVDSAAGHQRDAEGEAARQQNPEPGAPDPGDAATHPATEANRHAAPRTAGNEEAPAIFQHQTAEAGSTQPPAQHNSSTAPPVAMPANPTAAPMPVTAREAKPEPQAGSAPVREESLIDQTKAHQPMRSLSLEFTPDGARDIKVRLSERAGDVHISLHGTDPSLVGRVREGVSDLVGSLSNAGYDAEAWTPDQGRQNQRQQSDQRQAPRKTSGGADAEEFNGILQQPIQEIS